MTNKNNTSENKAREQMAGNMNQLQMEEGDNPCNRQQATGNRIESSSFSHVMFPYPPMLHD